MTSLPNNRTAARKPTRLAVVRRDGRSLRIVIARAGKPGESPVVIESFRTEAVPDRKATRAAKPIAEHIVGVLPAQCTAWRAIDAQLPEAGASEDAVVGALALQAEVHAASTPDYRRCAGVLRLAEQGPKVAGVIAWTQDATEDVASLDMLGEVKTYVPAIVSLTWLARATGRTTGISVYAEPDSADLGTVMCVGAGETACAARALREDPADTDAWRDAVRGTANALALHLSIENPTLPPMNDTPGYLALPAAVEKSLISGAATTPGWWEHYGLCVGAAAAVLLAGADERPLLSMSFDAPGTKGPLLERAAVTLSNPRKALLVGALCVAALVLLPLGAAYARLAILQSRVAGQDKTIGLDAASKENDLYTFVKDRRWPMSKLLAELIGSAPTGVHIESVRMTQGQDIVVTGTIDNLDVLNPWITKLNADGVFEVTKEAVTSDGGTSRMTLPLRVKDATRAMNGDVAAITKATADAAANAATTTEQPGGTRTAGNNGRSNNGAGASGRNNGPSGRNNNNSGNNNNRTAGNNRNDRSDRTTRANTPASADPTIIPPPISDAEIGQLSRQRAMQEFTNRKNAASKSDVDAATKQRLLAESAKAQARMRQAAEEESRP